jgi:hypothetical protein
MKLSLFGGENSATPSVLKNREAQQTQNLLFPRAY